MFFIYFKHVPFFVFIIFVFFFLPFSLIKRKPRIDYHQIIVSDKNHLKQENIFEKIERKGKTKLSAISS